MTVEIYDSDLSENEEQYSSLADAVSQLDSTRRVQAPTRNELSTVVSEFHLPKEKTKKGTAVHVKELAAALGNKSAHLQDLGIKISSVIKKGKTLPRPLEAPVAERIKRTVGYENVKGELKKWSAVVEKNRVADHLSFPLKQGRVSLQSSHQYLNKFKPKTPLEIEMAKILGTGADDPKDDEDEINKNLEFPLTYEEMMEKRKELAKIRAKLSYQEAKAHRQSKIKSKKYHRILKKERIKQQLKEFEQLQKTDPEAALKKLEELDKSRAEERASLRHKSTGKWARNVAVRAKYDKESRKVLAEQLKLSRDLTAKVKNVASDDEISDYETPAEEQRDIFANSDNPWALKVSSEVSNFVSTCKKYWESKNKEKEAKLTKGKQSSSEVAVERSMTNELTASAERNSNALSVENNSSATVEEEKSNLDVESYLSNKTKTKEKKIVRNQTQNLTNGQCKSEGGAEVISNEKNKIVGKKTNGVSDSNILSKKKKSPKKVFQNKEFKGRKNKDPELKRTEKNLQTKICSTSGLWTVSELNGEKEKNQGKRKNIKDIDDLFEDLEEKLVSKTSKRLESIKKKYSKKKKNLKEKVESDSNDDDDLAFKNRTNLRPEMDEEMMETSGRKPDETNREIAYQTTALNFEISEINEAPPEIDPKKFIQVQPKKLKTKLPDNLTGDENDYMDDEEITQQKDIVEAFGDDDVVEEFEKMKKDEEENTKLDTPNALPGWGSWGGADIKPDEGTTKNSTTNVQKLPPRKDKNKKDIIIREKTNPKLLEHMVKDVPHPFKSVGAFESNLRHPVGRDWIPETAHRKFIKKPVETLLGTIIEPMDTSELLRLQKQQKSLYRGKKKQKH